MPTSNKSRNGNEYEKNKQLFYNTNSSSNTPIHQTITSSSSSVSARKLANALWEIKNSPSVGKSDEQVSDRSKSASRRRTRTLLLGYGNDNNIEDIASDLDIKHTALMEIEAHSQRCSHKRNDVRREKHFMELHSSLVTSKELVKILIRFCGLKEQKAAVVSLASALCTQLSQVGVHVNKLFQEQRYECADIICQRDEIRRNKEIEKTKVAAQSVLEELATERRLRRRAERLNKRLGTELAQMKNLLLKATKELENERKSREIIEKVCSEMVKDIGQDKVAVEEMKKESAKVLEELNEERQMLQLADEWREERVHMKLSEAKFRFEEKNAAVERLRNELESFLAEKRDENEERDAGGDLESKHRNEHINAILNSLRNYSYASAKEEGQEGGQNDDIETDSEDNDLHSIELNMDDNNKGLVWSYAAGNMEHVEEPDVEKEKREDVSSYLDRVSRNFSGESGVTDETELDGEKFEDLVEENELVDEAQQLEASEESKTVRQRSLPSPIKQWERWQASKYKAQQQGEGSKIAELVKAIRESESKAGILGSRNEVHCKSQIGPVT